MHSWVFRNRRRLLALYGLRFEPQATDQKVPGSSSWDGGMEPMRPLLERNNKGQVVLFPLARHVPMRKSA
jgi:hypothetical protein